MSNICETFFAEGVQPTRVQADAFHDRLKAWYDKLPDCLKSKYMFHSSHFQIQYVLSFLFHLQEIAANIWLLTFSLSGSFYYHNLLVTLYQPFIAAESDRDQSPLQIVSDATKHTQTLLRIYYLRHSFEANDVFITQPLALTAFTCLSLINDKTPKAELEVVRSTLFLAILGPRDQARNFFVAETVYWLIQGRMRADEVALMENIASLKDGVMEVKQNKLQAVHSSWAVGHVSKVEDLEAHRLTKLVEDFVSANPSMRMGDDSDSEYESN